MSLVQQLLKAPSQGAMDKKALDASGTEGDTGHAFEETLEDVSLEEAPETTPEQATPEQLPVGVEPDAAIPHAAATPGELPRIPVTVAWPQPTPLAKDGAGAGAEINPQPAPSVLTVSKPQALPSPSSGIAHVQNQNPPARDRVPSSSPEVTEGTTATTSKSVSDGKTSADTANAQQTADRTTPTPATAQTPLPTAHPGNAGSDGVNGRSPAGSTLPHGNGAQPMAPSARPEQQATNRPTSMPFTSDTTLPTETTAPPEKAGATSTKVAPGIEKIAATTERTQTNATNPAKGISTETSSPSKTERMTTSTPQVPDDPSPVAARPADSAATQRFQPSPAGGTEQAPVASVLQAGNTGGNGSTVVRTAGTDAAPASETVDMDRVLEQVRVRLAPKRPEVTVVLDPPELGRLHLRLALRGGALSATVTVDDVRVAKAFEADVGHLVRTLDEAGIRVSEVEIRSGLTDDSRQRGTTHRGEDGHDRNQSESTRKQSKETHSRDDDKPDASQRNVVHGRSTTLDVVV